MYFQKKTGHETAQKKLEPYHPNAPRNRPKESVQSWLSCWWPLILLHPLHKAAQCKNAANILCLACAAAKHRGLQTQATPMHQVGTFPLCYRNQGALIMKPPRGHIEGEH